MNAINEVMSNHGTLLREAFPEATCPTRYRGNGATRMGSPVSLTMALPAHARAWLRQRESGAVALTAIEDAELRHLDDASALAQSEALLAATPVTVVATERRSRWSSWCERPVFPSASSGASQFSAGDNRA